MAKGKTTSNSQKITFGEKVIKSKFEKKFEPKEERPKKYKG